MTGRLILNAVNGLRNVRVAREPDHPTLNLD
jgi:hypothetical protein